MRSTNQARTYIRSESVVFSKTDEPFGGLSNMAGGFPLKVNGLRIPTSEALYQACRFPHKPDVQRLIIEQASPMTAKMKSKPYRSDSRPDWDQVRVKIMRWCLRVKLVQNWQKFSKLLLETDDRPIVEQSRKDDFWGAKPVDDQTLVGMNVLGRLLMELREEVRERGRAAFLRVEPLAIPDFLLLGKPIQPVIAEGEDQHEQGSPVQATLFNPPDQPLQHRQRGTAAEMPVQAKLFELPVQEASAESQGSADSSCMDIPFTLHPYPAYKDSGVPWLGQVPEHWEVRRFKYLLKERDMRSAEGVEQLLSVSQFTGVTVRRRTDGGGEPDTRAESLIGYKRVEPNDLVVNIMLAWNGSMGVSSLPGIVSPAYCVYRFNASAQPWYFHHLLRSPAYKARIKAVSTGVVESRLRLYSDDLYRLEGLLPPLPEQTAIVRFLEYMDRRIRRIMHARQRQIKLLEEYRQALIHQTVTGQIDVRTGKPYPAYKDSGVPWLGQVPEHWETCRLKSRLIKNDSGVWRDQHDPTGTIVLRSTEQTVSGGWKIENPARLHLTNGEREAYLLHVGDLVVTKSSGSPDHIGKTSLVTEDLAALRCAFSNFMQRLRLGDNTNPKLIWYYLNSRIGREQLVFQSTTTTGLGNLNGKILGNCVFALPPLPEQTAIVEYLDAETAKIDAAIAALRRENDLLREYRERLIADVVTGKVDVRAVAAQLPEELPEEENDGPEPLDEVETSASDGEDEEGVDLDAVARAGVDVG